ncbi:YmiA family putative membrane protein [Erwinia typographi]|uniref:YmiA family putative membrane protein n=1 Tax=Erwinia typographi TaxID=371042 RepID=UPI0009077273|nr:YmiA family putative membrane protein [Erwinia typographi]
MDTRLSVQPDFGHKTIKVQRTSDLKRRAWQAVFAGSAIFWMAVALLIWRVWG